jgi:hypothetical protein
MLQYPHTLRAGDHHGISEPQEEPMLENPGTIGKESSSLDQVRYTIGEPTAGEVVAVIGDDGPSIVLEP